MFLQEVECDYNEAAELICSVTLKLRQRMGLSTEDFARQVKIRTSVVSKAEYQRLWVYSRYVKKLKRLIDKLKTSNVYKAEWLDHLKAQLESI